MISRSDRPVSPDCSLDEALEIIVSALEGGDVFDRAALIALFPQWTADLNQFVDNWLAMEHKTSLLAWRSPNPDISLLEVAAEGKRIGDYELLELISHGGMGAVYRARQISLDRIVALKMVLNTSRDKTRFRIEAEAAASLHHANIVSIHEVGEFEGQPFLSMQFVSGGNLQQCLEQGPLDPIAAAEMVRTIALAVHYAHQRGILHRDLKPANVLIDSENRPFVADFGLAKQLGNSVELTRSGAILGTPGYMAPEQAMGQVKSITIAADVYGLGAILYATLTGEAPFKSDSDLVTLRKVIEEPPVGPRYKRPLIDRNLENICLKALEKAPTSRYSSAKQLADDLSRYLDGQPVLARPIGSFERSWRWCVRHPAISLLSAFAILMLIAVVCLVLRFAWVEYVARLDSESARAKEAFMTKRLDTARINAEAKSSEAQRAIADLYTTNGMWAARTHLDGEALLWFARASEFTEGGKSSVEANKVRCQSWFSQIPKPIAALQLPNPLAEQSFQQDWRSWKLSPSLSELMFKSGNEFGIWSYRSDEIWRPKSMDQSVTCAAWSPDWKSLALGFNNGEVRLLDASSKASQGTQQFKGQIEAIEFSPSGYEVAVGTKDEVVILRSSQGLPIKSRWPTTAACVRVSYSDDGSKTLVTTSDQKVAIFDMATEPPQELLQVPCYVSLEPSYSLPLDPQISKGGKSLFVRTEQSELAVFDLATGLPSGQPIRTGITMSIAISTDLTRCAAGGESYARLQSIRYRNGSVLNARHACRLVHRDAVTTLVFGGKSLIASGGRDRMVQLWDIGETTRPGSNLNDNAIPLATLSHTEEIVGMLFPDGGVHLVTVQRDGLIRIWRIPSFDPPGYSARAGTNGFTVKPVGKDRWLIAGSTAIKSEAINASLRRVKDGVLIAETHLNALWERGPLLDAAITNDEKKLISLHGNPRRNETTMITDNNTAGCLQIWDFPNGKPQSPQIKLDAEPRSVVLNSARGQAAVLLANSDIKLIDMAAGIVSGDLVSGDLVSVSNPNLGIEGSLQNSFDGSMLIAWGIGPGFKVWDWETKLPKYSTEFANSWTVNDLAISPTSNLIAVAIGESNRLVLIDGDSGRVVREVGHGSTIRSVVFSPAGDELITACGDGRARVVKATADGQSRGDLFHDKSLLDACYSPDGRFIATLTSEMRVYLWRVDDRQWAIKPIPVPRGTTKIVFSGNSSHLMTMGIGSHSRVMNLAGYNLHQTLDFSKIKVLGELVASKFIGDRGIVNLSTSEWMKRWNEYQ